MRTFADNFYSCSQAGLPSQVICSQRPYELAEVLKHDFFAATALYIAKDIAPDSHPQKIILKINRKSSFLCLPLKWLGASLTKHEVGIIKRLKGISSIPNFLEYYDETGFIYEYIEGVPLDHKPNLPETFFDDLHTIVKKLHSRNVVYLDMNKRGNILLGRDAKPHLIDFQISHHVGDLPFGLAFISRALRKTLQHEDIYHVCKHKRKMYPDRLRPDEYAIAKKRSLNIRFHRAIAWPYKKIRRALLRMLYLNNILTPDDSVKYSPENDPAKYAR